MMVEVFEQEMGWCFACGTADRGAADICLVCGADARIAPADTLDDNAIQLGYSKDLGKQSGTQVAMRRGSGDLIVLEQTGAVSRPQPRRFKASEILTSQVPVRSLAAAALMSMEHAASRSPVDWTAFRDAVTEICLDDEPSLRRCAVELVRFGRTPLLAAVALTASESTWWTAIGDIVAGRTDSAVACLERLPRDRYPDSVPLLMWLLSQGLRDGDALRRAISRVQARVGTEDVLRSPKSVGLRNEHPERFQWLLDPTAGVGHQIGKSGNTPMRDLLAVHRGARPGNTAMQVTDSVPLSIIDSAIDKGAKIDLAKSTRPIEDLLYFEARTGPDDLTDAELTQIGFTTELARRRLVRGEQILDVGQIPEGSEIAAWAQFMLSGEITDELRRIAGPITEDLGRFWADPKPTNVTERLAQEAFLWPHLHHRLADKAGADLDASRGSQRAEFFAWRALHMSIDHLLDAQWDDALSTARTALKLSSTERTRDEALNAIACAHWQLGNDEEACKALESALDGSRNESLQVNLGVVARKLDPETAATEFARLVNEGTTLELRCAAAMQATHIWLSDEQPWESDHDDGLPSPIRDALRSIVCEPIPLETFRSIVALQANLDSEWLSSASSLKGSTHSQSLEARVYRAKATDSDDLIEELTNILKRPAAPEWVKEERDSFIGALTRHALDDLSSAAALYALHCTEKGLPVEPEQLEVITPLAVIAVCRQIDPEEGEPADRFDAALRRGEASARSRGTYEKVDELYEIARDHLVGSRVLFGAHVFDKAVDAYNTYLYHNSNVPRWRLDMSKVRAAFAPIIGMLDELARTLDGLRDLAVNDDIKKMRDDLRNGVDELRRAVNGLVS